jgi:hypothetical protein
VRNSISRSEGNRKLILISFSLGEVTEFIDDLVLSCRRALIAPLCCSVPHLLLGSELMILRITGASFVLPDLVGPFLYLLLQVSFHRSAPSLGTAC